MWAEPEFVAGAVQADLLHHHRRLQLWFPVPVSFSNWQTALMSGVEEDLVEMLEDGGEVVQDCVDGCLDDEVLENANLRRILEHRAYHDVHNNS